MMHSLRLIPMVGFCAVSVLSSSAMAQLWAVNCQKNQCLDATTGNPNGIVQVSDCDDSLRAQQWYADTSNLPSPIQNAYEGFGKPCLDLSVESDPAQNRVVTNRCNSNLQAQNWNFVPNGQVGPIKNAYTDQCIEVADDGTVVPTDCNDEQSQRWAWVNVGDDSPDCSPQTATTASQLASPVSAPKQVSRSGQESGIAVGVKQSMVGEEIELVDRLENYTLLRLDAECTFSPVYVQAEGSALVEVKIEEGQAQRSPVTVVLFLQTLNRRLGGGRITFSNDGHEQKYIVGNSLVRFGPDDFGCSGGSGSMSVELRATWDGRDEQAVEYVKVKNSTIKLFLFQNALTGLASK